MSAIFKMVATIPQKLNTPSFMKFCPVVPEICHGQVHVPKKERRRIIIIIINRNNKKRSKNNKSPNVVWET
jgi:hypothetical protein